MPTERPGLLRWLPVALLAIGLPLMALKIVADSEPGALPLLLVLAGCIGLVAGRLRTRRQRAHRKGAE